MISSLRIVRHRISAVVNSQRVIWKSRFWEIHVNLRHQTRFSASSVLLLSREWVSARLMRQTFRLNWHKNRICSELLNLWNQFVIHGVDFFFSLLFCVFPILCATSAGSFNAINIHTHTSLDFFRWVCDETHDTGGRNIVAQRMTYFRCWKWWNDSKQNLWCDCRIGLF